MTGISYILYLHALFGLFGLKLGKTIAFRNQTLLCLMLSGPPVENGMCECVGVCILTLGLGPLNNTN